MAILNILNSIELQSAVPLEVIIVDASEDNKTKEAIKNKFESLNILYFLVEGEHRGLTKQRNFGLDKLTSDTEIVIFLDDDLILEKEFCQNILSNFNDLEIIGAEGYITNELKWEKIAHNEVVNSNYFHLDSYQYKLSARDRVRKYLGLYPSSMQPGLIPEYGHGKSSLPPTNKVYFVEHIMGGITAYRKSIFDHIQFSEFFEGYGLYEDFDFSIRASAFGKLVAVTSAKCAHHHDPSGRPNYFKYGRMVVWNGYYVWRLKHPKPGCINIVKWYLITMLLIVLRMSNLKKDGLREGLGRIISLIKLQFIKPI
jgi:GT2 family glycosyltransferase